jgi:hypothetical protein
VTTEEFRAALMTELVAWGTANYPTLPLIYENGPVPDEDAIGPIWLDSEIRWYGGNVASLGVNPRLRHTGAVSLQVYSRQASGTGQAGAILDSLIQTLSARRLGSAILLAPQRTVPSYLRGWYRTGILLPFTLG